MKSWSRVGVVAAASAISFGAITAPGVQAAEQQQLPQEIQDWLNSDMTPTQWGLRGVNAPAAHDAGFDGTGVTVAVIDSGVDATHPELQGQVLAGVKYGAGEKKDTFATVPLKASDNSDEDGHGTHVAGIIAAKNDGKGTTGIAPGAKILPISVLNSDMAGLSYRVQFEAIADAVNVAAERGVKIINMSLGGPAWENSVGKESKDSAYYKNAQQKLCDAIEKAQDDYGVTTFVASGNDAVYGASSNPAVCDAAVSVAAVGSDLRPTYFSSYDDSVDVAAPGGAVLSTVLESRYASLDGTSMASPHAAAVAALILDQNRRLTPDQLQQKMEDTALDVHRPGYDVRTGYGLVDAAAALGVTAPAAEPSESFAVGFRFATNLEWDAMAYWSAPNVGDVNGYTVYDHNTVTGVTTTTELSKYAVRLKNPVPLDGTHYVRVVANLADGAKLDGGWSFLPDYQKPPALTGYKVKLVKTTKSKAIYRVSWNVPTNLEKYIDPTIHYGDANDKMLWEKKEVDLAAGNATIVLPLNYLDIDIQFAFVAFSPGDFLVQNVYSNSPSFAYITSAYGIGRKVEIEYTFNQSAFKRIKPKTGKNAVVEVRNGVARGKAARYAGKIVVKPTGYTDGPKLDATFTRKVKLPVRVLDNTEFRLGVMVNGKRVWTPWRSEA